MYQAFEESLQWGVRQEAEKKGGLRKHAKCSNRFTGDSQFGRSTGGRERESVSWGLVLGTQREHASVQEKEPITPSPLGTVNV